MNLADPLHQHISLMHGWAPTTVQAVATAFLLLAFGRRSARWGIVWLPLALIVGVATAAIAHWYIDSAGLADDPAPQALWIWIGLTGLAAAVLLLGWRRARWWRRGASLMAVPLCLLSSALALNVWVGYFPTVQTAWNQLTSRPLPDQTDVSTVTRCIARRQCPPRARSFR